ncbi:MAG: right-handed parallel beta-helix repeat-containing protein [Candidatus Moranbacteria bacterium]|nr:right-handed parallel beta-helix repeat-containing protein [Candidatus Moranbacteria bacterium]
MKYSSLMQYKLAILFAMLSVAFCFQGVSPAYAAASGLEKQLKSGKKDIHFANASSGDIRIRKNVSVTGDNSKAVINGDVRMENGSTLRNVTVDAKVVGISVTRGASVTLINVTIKGASDAGIMTQSGGGTLTIKDSRITKNRKGMYIHPGKSLAITNNDITNNKEEGIDIRNNVSGTIANNRISNNKESGLEIVVNGSSLSVSRNTLVGNTASGLSLQSYPKTSKSGNVTVSGNTLASNKKFGVSCGSPSGGKKPAGFFSNSIHFAGNSFEGGNSGGNIQKVCGVGK